MKFVAYKIAIQKKPVRLFETMLLVTVSSALNT